MNDDAGFLNAIKENRDDPAHRLVYADWLDERDDSRGEYLRLASRLAELRERIDPAWLTAVREGRFQGELHLQSRRVVWLRELRQSRVYEGLLEGLPTTDMNQGIIEGALRDERARLGGAEPYLIQPEEHPIPYRGKSPYPFGTPASIPPVGCVGRFYSYQPTQGSGQDFSELVVIWFQDDFAFPIDAKVWASLLAIDWDQHANNYDY